MHEGPKIDSEFIENTNRKVETGLFNSIPTSLTELEFEVAGDPLCEKAFSEMMRYARDYVADVWDMKILLRNRTEYTDEEWADMFARADDERTRKHNLFIDSIAILSRALGKAERDNDWVKSLMSGTTLNRAACGKLGIMLVYQEYVKSTE